MTDAARVKFPGVGPMAAVAGAIAEFVGEELLAYSPEVIIENGGDIYIKSLKKRVVGIYAGNSPLTGKIGLEIEGKETPIGICTSSGTVGHSLSFGRADAVASESERRVHGAVDADHHRKRDALLVRNVEHAVADERRARALLDLPAAEPV